jgi:hypothetical protein
MKLQLEWGRQITLSDASRQNLIYSFDHSSLPEVAGAYVFGPRRLRCHHCIFSHLACSRMRHARCAIGAQPMVLDWHALCCDECA